MSSRRRGAAATVVDVVDAVVNATGPDTDPRRSRCPLVRSLLAQGLAQPDELGLGWGTSEDGRLLSADGEPSPVLFYAGPLLRARVWETTAVPELRDHVDRSVDTLALSLAVDQAARRVK